MKKNIAEILRMPGIASNIESLRRVIPPYIKLVAVSKTKPVSDIIEAYNTGQRIFGENRVQELLSKKDILPADIEWHLIGHLQSNKVKYIVPFISMIQSVDSFKLLTVINDEAKKAGKLVKCLLQFHIASEETKFGFSLNEAKEMLDAHPLKLFDSVAICGVMGMATFTEDMTKVRDEFRTLSDCFNMLKQKYFADHEYFKEISMGMSGDYIIAIEEGSTIIRIGSIIFGERNQLKNQDT